MLFKVCKLKYFILLFIIILTHVKLDLPIHTLTKDVIGIWKIYETELYDKFQNCGSTYPNKNIENLKIDNFKEYLQEIYGELYVKFIELSDERFFNRTLLYPRNTWSYFTIKNPLNNQILGHWTLVYDEGVMIDINDKNYFGYFKYNNIKNNECKQITQNIEDEYGNIKCYVTDSNRLQIGWYSKKINNNYKFGCFYMEKLKYNNNKNYIIDLTFNTKHNELEFSTPSEFSTNFPLNNPNSPNNKINTLNSPNSLINPINTPISTNWKNKLDIGLNKLGIGYENISPLRFIQLCKGVNYHVINNFNTPVTVTGPPNSNGPEVTNSNSTTNNLTSTNTNTSTQTSTIGASTVTEENSTTHFAAPGKGANFMPMECTSEKNTTQIAAPNVLTSTFDTTKDTNTTTTGKRANSMVTKCTSEKNLNEIAVVTKTRESSTFSKDSNNTLTTSTTTVPITVTEENSTTHFAAPGKGANSTAMECTSEKNPNEIAIVTNSRESTTNSIDTKVNKESPLGVKEPPLRVKESPLGSVGTGCRRPVTVTEQNFPNNWTWGDPFNGLEEDIYTTSQGECGSCYIYSSLYVISKRYQILFKKLYPNYNWKLKQFQLSINDILTSPYSQGCYGGFLMLVGKHIKEFGIHSNNTINNIDQFEQLDQFEQFNDQNDNKWYIENYGYVGGCYECTNEINMMNEIITNGPIAVAIYSPIQLFYYTNGIFNNNYKHGIICDLPYNNLNGWEYTNHAIIIVGWGIEIINDEEIKYWICKNTWGKNWGIEGYFKIKKGINLCGIESQAVYFDPTLIKGLSKQYIQIYNKIIK